MELITPIITPAPGTTENLPDMPDFKQTTIIVSNTNILNAVFLPQALNDFLNDSLTSLTYSKSIAHLITYGIFSNCSVFDLRRGNINYMGYGQQLPIQVIQEFQTFIADMFNHQDIYPDLLSRFGFLCLMNDAGVVPATASPFRITYNLSENGINFKYITLSQIERVFEYYHKVKVLEQELTLQEKLSLKDISILLMIIASKPNTTGTTTGLRALTVELSSNLQPKRKTYTESTWHQVTWALFLLYLIDLTVQPPVIIVGSENGSC